MVRDDKTGSLPRDWLAEKESAGHSSEKAEKGETPFLSEIWACLMPEGSSQSGARDPHTWGGRGAGRV